MAEGELNRGFGRVDGGKWGVGGVGVFVSECAANALRAERRMPAFAKSATVSGGRSKVKIPTLSHKTRQGWGTRVFFVAFEEWCQQKSNQFGWPPNSTQRGGVAVDGGASGWSRKYWSTGSLRSMKWKPLRVLASTVVCKSSAAKGITCSAGFVPFWSIMVK